MSSASKTAEVKLADDNKKTPLTNGAVESTPASASAEELKVNGVLKNPALEEERQQNRVSINGCEKSFGVKEIIQGRTERFGSVLKGFFSYVQKVG